MTSTCDDLAPAIFRVAERESSPDESLRVARHVADCTGCRIRFARERRLGTMLEDELEELTVDDQFVQRVMDRLPAEAPPVRPRRRRGLKLAAWAGSIGIALGSLLPELAFGSTGGRGFVETRLPMDPSLPADGAGHVLTATIQLLQGAASLFAAWGSLPAIGGILAAVGATVMLTLLLGGSAALGMVGHLAWGERRSY